MNSQSSHDAKSGGGVLCETVLASLRVRFAEALADKRPSCCSLRASAKSRVFGYIAHNADTVRILFACPRSGEDGEWHTFAKTNGLELRRRSVSGRRGTVVGMAMTVTEKNIAPAVELLRRSIEFDNDIANVALK